LPDPRLFASSADAGDTIVKLAQASLATELPVRQEKLDASLRDALQAVLEAGEGARLERAIAHAPNVDVARHVWRRLAEAFAPADPEAPVTRVFALPVVLVAGGGGISIPAVLHDVKAVAETLQAHGAL